MVIITERKEKSIDVTFRGSETGIVQLSCRFFLFVAGGRGMGGWGTGGEVFLHTHN